MEYRLPALFERLSEADRAAPLNKLDRILRNHLIADMMNSGILQFSQAAVDEILTEVDTKEKLDKIYKQVKELKAKLPQRQPMAGSTFKVDTLLDGSLPLLKTNKDVEHLTEPSYKDLDIDHSVINIFPATIAEQTKTPAPSKEVLEEKKSEIKERIKHIETNSFTRPGMPTPRQLVTPNDFLTELLDMGMFHNSFEEQDQYVKFVGWTSFNFDSLRNFIKVFRKCKSPAEKKILVSAIKEVIRDINASRTVNNGDAFHTQNLLNRLVNCNIFLTAKEKETFIKWDATERADLERRITNYEFGKISVVQDAVVELASANDIRDHILKINRTKEYAEHQDIIKDIQQGEPLKSPIIRGAIKDMVHKLRVWGVIDNNAEACDTQYNKCMKWAQRNINNIENELNKISEGVLLFEELTKGQLEFLRANINYYNDFPQASFRMSPPLVTPPSYTDQPLPPPASFKYNDQFDTLTTPGFINMNLSSHEDVSTWKDIYHDICVTDKANQDMFNWRFPKGPDVTMSTPKKEDSKFVGEVKKAGVRVATTQLNKVTKGVLAAALPGDKTAMLQQFLDSELGTSFISMVNGMALTYGLKDNERAQIMAKEFRISSLTTAGNFAVEEILDLVSGVVADALADNISDSIKKSEEEEIEITYEDIIEEKLLKA